jgi:hypothetical protein
MAQDTQIYRFFLDNPPSNQFLFKLRIVKNFRPKLGDSLTDPITQRSFKVMRDEIPTQTGAARVTHGGAARITDNMLLRIVGAFVSNQDATHNYFVQPANKRDRVSTWTRSDFADDRTLQQLFR